MLPMPLLMLLAAFTGPANCRFVVPADIAPTTHPGNAEWLGSCAAGLAEGVGVLRVAQPDGRVALFYGQLRQGIPTKGIFGDSDGHFTNPVHSFSPRTGHSIDDNSTANPAGQDVHLWSLAASAALAAAKHYDALGNKASADFYRSRARDLSRGPGE